jgi:outer membrane protein OmpU
MKRILLGSTALVGAATLGGAAQASDGVKLDVGGFFNTVYQGVFDKKEEGRFGNHRTTDHFTHNAEVWIEGETTLDNGLTVGAKIEIEAENANDQIDKSFVYWSGGFGKVQLGSQDGPIGGYCILPPGATGNFSAFSPNVWGSNDPVGSNAACIDVLGNAQSILYATPVFSGFQLRLGYTPNNNAEDYTQAGVNSAGTPTSPDGTATHSFAAYATYSYSGEDWGLDWGGGGSWQGKFNGAAGVNDGASAAYQTGLNLAFGNFGVGAVMEYFETGGADNDAWVAGGGISYGVDAWTVGLQGSHGHYDGIGPALNFAANPGGSRTLDRIILTGNYALGPGVDLDAELGYTWFHDSGDLADDDTDDYQAFSAAIGSRLTF